MHRKPWLPLRESLGSVVDRDVLLPMCPFLLFEFLLPCPGVFKAQSLNSLTIKRTYTSPEQIWTQHLISVACFVLNEKTHLERRCVVLCLQEPHCAKGLRHTSDRSWALQSGYLGCHLSTTTYQLGNPGQVTSPLCAQYRGLHGGTCLRMER